jgi:hypothetical protein
MLDVFSPLTGDARSANYSAYREYLGERDGPLDVDARTLSRREEGMIRYSRPLSRMREVDQALFHAQYASFDARRPMSQEALLLMALVKINASEAYGVSRVFDVVQERAELRRDDVELTLLVEETYHTRILLSSALLYGLEISAPFDPPLGVRVLIAGLARAPEALARPLMLAGEILSALTFLNLLDATREILKHDPELRDAIEERVMEVLVDELGHITFNRLLLDPTGLTRARWLMPMVALGMSRSMPELGAIGLRTSAVGADTVTTCARLPAAVRKAAFVA